MRATCATANLSPVVSLKAQSGVTLIESLVAILILSLGILGMIGLQATAVRDTMEADYRIKASYLANQIISTMWVDRTNLTDYDTGGAASSSNVRLTAWKDAVSAALPDATGGANAPTISVAGTQVDVTVSWQKAGETSPHRFMIRAYINGAT